MATTEQISIGRMFPPVNLMARVNTAMSYPPVLTHEGGTAQRISPYAELRRSVLTCLLWEPTFYEKGDTTAQRIAELIPKVDPAQVAALAIEARDKMLLRHVPLFLIRELTRRKGSGGLVADALPKIIQRADELAEFCAMYWKEKRQPLSAGAKRGLAAAFQRFDAYRLAKYNRDNAVKLRDVLFLCHAKPKDEDQAATWKKLVDGTLESPDTWEVELSAGKDKRETFERLMREGKLGGLAVLRNLRGMLQAGVSEPLIRERLSQGISKALPFRFVVAAKHAPRLEDAIELAMLQGTAELPPFPGRTGLLIDVSGSMDQKISAKAPDTSRIDVAAALAILLREKATAVRIATFSDGAVEVPARRGFALRDAIKNSQQHRSTMLSGALMALKAHWTDIDRLIVITDEQSQDGGGPAFAPRNWVVNVAAYKNGVGYGNDWNRVDGWSDRVLDYIVAAEAESES